MMAKFFGFLVVCALFFSGCEDEQKKLVLDLNETAPGDVPIAPPDANISIDENLPPEPAMEGNVK